MCDDAGSFSPTWLACDAITEIRAELPGTGWVKSSSSRVVWYSRVSTSWNGWHYPIVTDQPLQKMQSSWQTNTLPLFPQEWRSLVSCSFHQHVLQTRDSINPVLAQLQGSFIGIVTQVSRRSLSSLSSLFIKLYCRSKCAASPMAWPSEHLQLPWNSKGCIGSLHLWKSDLGLLCFVLASPMLNIFSKNCSIYTRPCL